MAFLYRTYGAHALRLDNTLFSDPEDPLTHADEPSSPNVYTLTPFSPKRRLARERGARAAL